MVFPNLSMPCFVQIWILVKRSFVFIVPPVKSLVQMTADACAMNSHPSTKTRFVQMMKSLTRILGPYSRNRVRNKSSLE